MVVMIDIYSENLRKLVEKMLEKNAEKRINIEQILNLDFIKFEVENLKTFYDDIYNGKQEKQKISFADYLNEKLEFNYSFLGSFKSENEGGHTPIQKAVSFHNNEASQFEEYLKNREKYEGIKIK